MKIIIINNETKNIKKLVNMLKQHEIKIFQYNEKYNVQNSDLIILSGGSHHSIFNKTHPYQKELELIKNTQKPIIGICLGAQLIAQAFMSSFGELSDKLQKNIKIKNIHGKSEHTVYEAHRYYIDKLGKKLEGLYKSQFGRELIKHKEKNIYGLQFHPEITKPINDGKNIFDNILKNIFN